MQKFSPYRKGDSGAAIADIQRRLQQLGYSLGNSGIDGYFGDNTLNAVKAFQADQTIAADGLVGRTTWYRLLGLCYKLGDRLLYLRFPPFRGNDVKELQRLLAGLGFRVGPLDGIYGIATEKAVREFQRNMSLTVDGLVGDATILTLKNLNGILNINPKTVFPWNLVAPQPGYSHLAGKKLFIMHPQIDRGSYNGKGLRQLAAQIAHLLRIAGAKVTVAASEFSDLKFLKDDAYEHIVLAIGLPSTSGSSEIRYFADRNDAFPLKKIADDLSYALKLVCGNEVSLAQLNSDIKAPILALALSPSDIDAIDFNETFRQRIAVAITDTMGKAADLIPSNNQVLKRTEPVIG